MHACVRVCEGTGAPSPVFSASSCDIQHLLGAQLSLMEWPSVLCGFEAELGWTEREGGRKRKEREREKWVKK